MATQARREEQVSQRFARTAAEGLERQRLLRAFEQAYPQAGLTPEERQRAMTAPLSNVRAAVQRGNIGPIVDIGSPHFGPAGAPLPVTGNIPGLRTLPEAAATIGTAGLGTAPLTSKVGGALGALGGGYGGREIGREVGGSEGAAIGEVAGTLAGGLAGGVTAPLAARGVEQRIAAEGGPRAALLAGERGGTRLPKEIYDEHRALKTLVQEEKATPEQIARHEVLREMIDAAQKSERGGTQLAKPDTFESARKTLLTGLKKRKTAIQAVGPVRAQERQVKLTDFQTAYDRALAEGKPEREAFALGRAAQRGEYTAPEARSVLLDPEQEQAVINRIKTFDFGRGPQAFDWERQRAMGTLYALSDGQSVTMTDIASLEKVLGKDVGRAIRQNAQVKGGKLDLLYDILVTPKALLSAFDLSYPLRQGIMLAPGHPVEFGKSFGPMIRSFARENIAQGVYNDIASDPRLIPLITGETISRGTAAQKYGLIRTLDPTLSTSEEAFRSSLADKIPMVRASNRAFTTFGNKFRSDVFNTIVNTWERRDIPITEGRLQDLSNLLNRFSGRGTLGDEEVTKIFQALWWSPQSRVAPVEAVGQLFHADPLIRAEAWRNMVAFISAGSAILGAAALGGYKVNTDPKNADFGKIRVGKTHVNIWGPVHPQVRMLARIMQDPGRSGTEIQRYFRSGLAPEWAAAWDVSSGENYLGEPMKADWQTVQLELPQRMLPLAGQDFADAIELEFGEGKYGAKVGRPGAAVFGPPILFGSSISTYSDVPEKLRQIPKYNSGDLALTPDEEFAASRELDKFQAEIDSFEKRAGPLPTGVDWVPLIASYGQEHGLSDREIKAMAFLKQANTSQINPQWIIYLLEHEDELSQRYPDLYTPKYMDAARQLYQRSKGQ